MQYDNIQGLERDAVAVGDIDPLVCRSSFIKEKQRLTQLLSSQDVKIEHVGSTSVPGIAAKPIIDIAIGVSDLTHGMRIIDILVHAGYIHRSGHGDMDRLLCIKVEKGRRTHHLHVEVYRGQSWFNHICFRNCLLGSPKLCLEYSVLKQKLAKEYPDDRRKYTEGKAVFIQKTIARYQYENGQAENCSTKGSVVSNDSQQADKPGTTQ